MAESIAAQSDPSNADDDLFDETSYTTSVESSITDYKYEHGRRYHAYQEGRYLLPNDEIEQNRLDLQYHAVRLVFGDKLFFAPVEMDRKRILDVGTGTGIWVEDMADAYPDVEIYGIDLSPIQPRWSAPNVKYQVDDVEQPWTYPSSHFDFIHTRIMLGSLRDWPNFFTQCIKHLRPGGYVECQEIAVDARTDDDSFPENSALTKWCDIQQEAMWKIGMELKITGNMIKDQMVGAGFVDVVVKEFKTPIGQWPKDPKMRETGAFQLVAMLEGIGGLTMALWTRLLGWKKDDVEEELVKVRKEMESTSVHSYWPTYAVYGRKPEEQDDES
ncbi:MAG: hypothetical protein LQ339_005182 [Xanthoria mediterranea]|nr:MAG: hypothetical protein LQ339_005182 [Xanthoria mediterranea]